MYDEQCADVYMYDEQCTDVYVMMMEWCAAVVESVRREAAAIRKELLAVLGYALCGDQLAAEFLLCHLISTV